MIRRALFNLSLMCVMLALVLLGCEEPTDPSLTPPEIEAPAPVQPASAPAAPAPAPRTPGDYRKLAEGGDVPSMLLLGRSHESLGQAKEARRWYQRAADAGSEDGKKALANIDSPPTRPASATAPTALAQAGTGSPSSPSSALPPTESPGNLPATQPAVVPLPPGDPNKIRWIDLVALVDARDMVADTRTVPLDPSRPGADPDMKSQFIGLITAKDGSITLAATGPNDGELAEVTVVIRVRNKQDPGSSARVGQAGSVARRVTADNITQPEFLEWVIGYVRTEQRSEPIFRNGWRLTVSGFAAEGRPDPKGHQGLAVMIEMKK